MNWFKNHYYKLNIKSIFSYFINLVTKNHFLVAIFGFFVFLIIISQIFSGIILSFSLLPEPMMIPIIRDEEDSYDLYTDDFFWLHERGVDFIFITVYVHFLRKFFLKIFYFEQEFAWKSGVFSFLIIHVVTFFGLVLCCTHLSDVTLSIAANILHTFLFYFKGKMYWWLFTDKSLNSDTLIRLAYGHYVIAFYLVFLSFFHAIDMHFDWKYDINIEGVNSNLIWWDESFSNELISMAYFLGFVFTITLYMFTEPEALSYEIFMWGDIGLVNDVRFYGVAPHWYFRPFMAWLAVCPMHVTGIMGIILYFFSIYHQPSLFGDNKIFLKKKKINFSKKDFKLIDRRINLNEYSFTNHFFFYLFVMAIIYSMSFLPSGRYYQRVHGNDGMLLSFFYILIYLTYGSNRDFFLFKVLKNKIYFKSVFTNNFFNK